MSSSSNNRDLFFTPTSANNNGDSATASPAADAVSPPASAAADQQPPVKEKTYLYPKKEKEPRKYIDKEELNPSEFQKMMASRVGTPHFSQLTEPHDSTNPVTGRSIYFALYPWRCSDRLSDWVQSIVSFDGPRTQLHHYRITRACSKSALGDEPLDPYVRIPVATALFYKERADSGMMRLRFWEQYPFDVNELRRVGEADAVRMRAWRQQRRLEEVAKQDQVEDLIRSSVLVSNRTREDKLYDATNPYNAGIGKRE